jgi:hypothetical protein
MISGVTINTDSLNRLTTRLNALVDVADPSIMAPIMEDLGKIIIEDNRFKVLNGLDKDGNAAPPLKYRGVGVGKVTKAAKDLERGTVRRKGITLGGDELRYRASYRTKGMGTSAASYGMLQRGTDLSKVLPYGNLTSAQYRQLRGPRLAPRGEHSRSIASLMLLPSKIIGGVWYAVAEWKDVLTPKGLPLLPPHFNGRIRNTRAYDLRGVTPKGQAKAASIASVYFRRLIKAVLAPVQRPGERCAIVSSSTLEYVVAASSGGCRKTWTSITLSPMRPSESA